MNPDNDLSMLTLRRGLVLGSLALAGAAALATGCLHVPPPVDQAPPPGSVWDGPGGGEGLLHDQLTNQTVAEKTAKSQGCTDCHGEIEPMHSATRVHLGCIDCHGGDATATTKEVAHVLPRDEKLRDTSAVPESQSAEWIRNRFEYVRFVNPGDLRVVDTTCGVCHPNQTYATKKSMMAHGAMLWGAALYNNGSFPLKRARFGEAYDAAGNAVRLQTVPPPTSEDILERGVLPFLDPLPRYNIAQMGNILRVFERGGKRPLELGNPDREEEAGLPARRLSQRGLGTLLRTDPVFLGLAKTRLLDPVLWMPGTNDHPGDYRHSGCTACHVVYANDRDPEHSGAFAQYGNRGRYHGDDKVIPRDESGHPVRHQMTRGVPSSQCMTCHMHPGTNMLSTYYGNLWYDNETDAHLLFDGREPTADERHAVNEKNPQGAAVRGKWSDPDFLADIALHNDEFDQVQFADYHGHGWLFRKVWKKDRDGNLLDAEDKVVSFDDPDVWDKAVHLKDIHLERGMHCTDCHFSQDVHGTGKLHGEPRAATEIKCVDCHGDVDGVANMQTSGPAGPSPLSASRNAFDRPRFKWDGGVLYQYSQLDEDLVWAVPQVADSVDPSKKDLKYFPGDPERERSVFNERACYAKTMQKDGRTWGDAGADGLAHQNERMSCAACHTSWTTSCFGCHLPMEANARKDIRHYEGGQSRNWVGYNFQVLRDAAYMLGVDGTVTGNKISPARSACAIVVGSKNQNREFLYSQQQTISAEGFSGQAFSTYVPHTVRTRETKGCTDCHISEDEDNNAIMAQLLLHGTNYTNFLGRLCYVGCGDAGFYAVVVSERDEPQAVYGSTLHRDAYPARYAEFVEKGGRVLTEAYHHGGTDTRSIQLRGEYLYAAEGAGGLQVYDVANIDNKGFSERITTSTVSPLGQRLAFDTEFATAVASPTTLGVDPTRPRIAENEEGPIHPMYAFLYVTDRKEGLIMTVAATLLDGDPANNFLERDLVFNPDGLLDGAEAITVAGAWAYVACDRGLVVLDLSGVALDAPTPRVARVIGPDQLRGVTSVSVQFRYAFVTDADGLKVLDVTDPARATVVPGATIALAAAHDVYVARTFAYVSAGAEGLVIVDVKHPKKPRIHQRFTADGALSDTRQCRIAMTNASLFAYVADGINGLRVIQLTAPETVPQFAGFSPAPKPVLIATYPTPSPAIALSKPLDRDRAVDESGNQLAVFGRVGARPLDLDEQRRFYIRDGRVWRVRNEPKAGPVAPAGTK
jgi:hypothetical protein